MIRRALIVVMGGLATLTLVSGSALAVVRSGSMGQMDMDGDHGHGSGSKEKHGKNARVATGAREIEVDATSFEFTPDEIAVSAGEDVAIVLHSDDGFHDFVVKGEGHVVSAKRNKTGTGGLTMDEPGTYRLWCSVPGHRAAGMRGTIVVT